MHLEAARTPDGPWLVTGGAADHLVTADGTSCDCTDYAMRGGPCKHMLAVRLRLGDAETLGALRSVIAPPSRPRRRV